MGKKEKSKKQEKMEPAQTKAELKSPPKVLENKNQKKAGKPEKFKMQEKLENDRNKDKVEKKGEVPKSELKERKQPDFTIEMEYMAEMEAEGHQLDD